MAEPRNYFFDDVVIGEGQSYGPYEVTAEELIPFNRKWDPLPMHLDDQAAREKGHRGLTASGQYTLCVKQLFINQTPWRDCVIGALGFDEVRFPHPVYVGDQLSATIECIDKRASQSKLDRGIVKFVVRVFNQNDETVLSYIDTVMFKRLTEKRIGDDP
ncbi:MAG: MaoC/PaaZ C-terminal domain-containing protein [Proteobacteria bacterium]|nr:MaoC/PaaZ C-terminal domain-containing protein [Pseudomonadota bacterium]